MNMCKSSTPAAWHNIIKPALIGYKLNNKVNKLLDYYEGNGNEISRAKLQLEVHKHNTKISTKAKNNNLLQLT